jgi:hypothetical protein
MFSAWDFHSWSASLGIVLFMGMLITGFGALVGVVISRIWGDERDVAASLRVSRTVKKPPFREAA